MTQYGRTANVTPSAARLTESLRDIGYDFPAAVADLVDNSIAAGSSTVDIDIAFAGEESFVMICDDGTGMSESGLTEAMRFGTRREYALNDLGRYGLGLKTASLSQCRSLTVVTRQAPSRRRIAARELSLDLIAELDEWVVVEPEWDEVLGQAIVWLSEGPGTVAIWRNLDRVLPEKRPDGGWARRRVEQLAKRTAEHLAMVFHRYLESGNERPQLTILVNGEKVEAWNPFAPSETARRQLPEQRFEVVIGDSAGVVSLRRYVLPAKNHFSSQEEFERCSGPLKWNRQQGLYIYRAGRLVQWGGWNGFRAIDEHTKLARASVDFDTDLDHAFNINVAKMGVSVPHQLKGMLERPINELCLEAGDAYRQASHVHGRGSTNSDSEPTNRTAAYDGVGLALRAAAMHAGEYPAFQRILEELQSSAPQVARELGLAPLTG